MSNREARKRARLRKRRIRAAVYILIVAGVLGSAGALIRSAFIRPSLPPIAGTVIDVAADMTGFDTPEIRLRSGEPVTIRLTSLDNSHHTDGGGQHQWAVDELGVNIVAPPEATRYATFTPDQPGECVFYCDICCGGRANPSMQGRLIVEA